MSDIFQKKQLVNPLSQASNRRRLLCMTKFESEQKRLQSEQLWKELRQLPLPS